MRDGGARVGRGDESSAALSPLHINGPGPGDYATSDTEGDAGLESPLAPAGGAIVPSGAPGRQANQMHISSFRRKAHMTWRDWLRVPEFYKVAGVYMCTRLATNVSQVYISFYVTATLDMSQTAIALVPLLLYISQLVATVVMKRVAALLGRHFSMLAGAILFGAACCAMLFIPASASWAAYPAMCFLGAGSAVITIISVSMEADLVGRNVESGAFVYGAMSLTDKLSNGIFIFAIQYAGNGLNKEATSRFVRVVNALVPLIAAALAAVITFTIPFPARLQGSQSFKDFKASFKRTPKASPSVASLAGVAAEQRVSEPSPLTLNGPSAARQRDVDRSGPAVSRGSGITASARGLGISGSGSESAAVLREPLLRDAAREHQTSIDTASVEGSSSHFDGRGWGTSGLPQLQEAVRA